MRRLLWPLPGLLALLGGGLLVTRTEPADLGWFAYAAPAGAVDTSFTATVVVMTRGELAGWVLVAVGLVATAGCVGVWWGRRT